MYKFGINLESRANKTTDELYGGNEEGVTRKTLKFLFSPLNGQWIIN